MDKLEIINNEKRKFDDQILQSINEINNNLDKIDRTIKLHNNFIDWITTINLYEKSEWDIIKQEYISIKKKINKDKKIQKNVIKFYCSLTNYYTNDEIEK